MTLITTLITSLLLSTTIAFGQKSKKLDMQALSKDKKKYTQENVILTLPDSQLSLSQTLSRNAYDGGQYIFRIHILDTSKFKTKTRISLRDTNLVVSTFSTGSQTPLDYLDDYRISGEIEVLSFNKKKITIKQNVKISGVRHKRIYRYKSQTTFIDETPWN